LNNELGTPSPGNILLTKKNQSFKYFFLILDSQSVHSDTISTKTKKKKTTTKSKKVLF